MKTIGLIGGLSWESSASYYRVINREVRKRLGGWHSSRLILDSLDFQQFAIAENKHDYARLRDTLIDSALRLEVAGAELILVACNTVHRFAQAIEGATQVPFLHIADSAGAALSRDGHTKVGLLGTQATMEGSFYSKRLAERFELEILVPERHERASLNSLIIEELNGRGESTLTAAKLDELIEGFASRGASAVLLACTELGLAFGNRDEAMITRALPAYDSAILHALAAVDASLELGL